MQIQKSFLGQLYFLDSNFLADFKKECQLRSKPSKSILQALKHSQSLYKALKMQNDKIKLQLQNSKQEIQMLKAMLENKDLEIKQYQKFKQDKLKKLKENETKLQIQISLFKNQNNILKKQIEYLTKQKSSVKININGLNFEALNNEKIIISPFKQHLSQRSCLSSAKFNQYVNFQDDKQKTYNHNQNLYDSKIQIDINKNSKDYKAKLDKQQCQELTKMLSLAYSMNQISHDQKQYHQEQEQRTYQNQSILNETKPFIQQIVSQPEIPIEGGNIPQHQIKNIKQEQKNAYFIQSQNKSNDLKITPLFHNNTSSIQYLKNIKQYTFLDIQTKKSIQQHEIKKINNSFIDSIVIKDSKNSDSFNQINKKNIKDIQSKVNVRLPSSQDEQQNNQMEKITGMSNFDYNGLLDDIYANQATQSSCQFPKKQQIQNKKQKQTEIFDYEKISLQCRKDKRSISLKMQSQYDKLINYSPNNNENKNVQGYGVLKKFSPSPSPSQKKNIKQIVENRYKNFAESYQTIELQNQQQSPKNSISPNNKPLQYPKKIQKFNISHLNHPIHDDKSSKQGNKMNTSKHMVNSKYSIFNNSRIFNNKKQNSPNLIKNNLQQPNYNSQFFQINKKQQNQQNDLYYSVLEDSRKNNQLSQNNDFKGSDRFEFTLSPRTKERSNSLNQTNFENINLNLTQNETLGISVNQIEDSRIQKHQNDQLNQQSYVQINNA